MTTRSRISLLFGAALAVTACAHANGSDATPASAMAQAHEGEEAYRAACLGCHTPDLGGSADAPVLAGRVFASRWNGRPVADLVSFTREHMPHTIPGSLNERTYLALVAYLLAKNGALTGEAPVTSDAVWMIQVGSP